MNFLVTAILAMLVLSAYGQKKEEKKLIVETILENDSRLEEFFMQSKADSIAGMFSPNSHLIVEYEGLIEKREEIEKHYQGAFKSGIKYTEFKLEAEEHKVYDDLVLEIGKNQIKYTIGKEGKVLSQRYNYMLVWKKSKTGNFQIRAATWNPLENPCE